MSLLDDALSRSLYATFRRGAHLSPRCEQNRIKLISFLIGAMLFDDQIPWDVFNQPLLSENNERYSMRKPV